MKKIISTVLAVALSSCAEKKYVEKYVWGETVCVCNDCLDEINELYE